MMQNKTTPRAARLVAALTCLALVGCWGGDNAAPDGSGATPPPGGSTPPPTGGNSPPSISGTPPTSATVGRQWSFQPSISDPDGDALTVTADNRPPWMSLNSSTGRLNGTPQAGDVLTWSNIRLTVSDGQATASLGGFSVVVHPVGAQMGSATLSWMPPTERTDGSPIGQLAGYEVLYGQVSRNYDTVVELDAGITRYVVQDLGPGTWYFAIRAVTADGLESSPSQEVSKTI